MDRQRVRSEIHKDTQSRIHTEKVRITMHIEESYAQGQGQVCDTQRDKHSRMQGDMMRCEIYTETNRVVCTETRLRADIHRETNRVVCTETG